MCGWALWWWVAGHGKVRYWLQFVGRQMSEFAGGQTCVDVVHVLVAGHGGPAFARRAGRQARGTRCNCCFLSAHVTAAELVVLVVVVAPNDGTPADAAEAAADSAA